jgi:hypothetical protein
MCYAKTGRLAYLSHLELVRALERLIRRSGLPFAVTQGFSAHMRHAPGPALPVGTRGLGELFDVWLTEYVKAEPALHALRRATVPGLEIREVTYVDPKAKGLAATHVIEDYSLEIQLGRGAMAEASAPEAVGAAAEAGAGAGAGVGAAAEAGAAAGVAAGAATEPLFLLKQGLARLLETGEVTIERKKGRREQRKTYDLRAGLVAAPCFCASEEAEGRYQVAMTLRSGPQGSIRPDVLLRAALAASDAPLDLAIRSSTRLALAEEELAAKS